MIGSVKCRLYLHPRGLGRIRSFQTNQREPALEALISVGFRVQVFMCFMSFAYFNIYDDCSKIVRKS